MTGWSCGFVKMFMDGVIDSGTAYMLNDYPDQPGHRSEPPFLFGRGRLGFGLGRLGVGGSRGEGVAVGFQQGVPACVRCGSSGDQKCDGVTGGQRGQKAVPRTGRY